jgi:hypothetical protein
MSSNEEKYMSQEKRANAKKILWSPWGDLPPRGGGGLPQGGDDDEDERVVRIIISMKKSKKFIKKSGLSK